MDVRLFRGRNTVITRLNRNVATSWDKIIKKLVMAIFIDKLIQWKDTGEITEVTFGIGDFDEKLDEDVFYWVEEKDDILSLMDKNGVEEFYILE